MQEMINKDLEELRNKHLEELKNKQTEIEQFKEFILFSQQHTHTTKP